MTTTQQLIIEKLPDFDFELDKPLAQLTYFKLGGSAEVYIESDDSQKVSQLLAFCDKHDISLTVLGGASNVIVADEGIKGLVIHLTNDIVADTGKAIDGKTIIEAGAGTKTALLVSQSNKLGLTGLEYFLGVPGTLGGAVYNNAHYLNHLISEYIYKVQIINKSGVRRWLEKAECDFSYDHSRFHTSQELIFAVQFLLPRGDEQTSRELIKEATIYRATTQPLGLPSSGCIFQNVPNNEHLRKLFPQFKDKTHVPGGFLIDQAGLKGTSIGGIEVSTKHAAFFINTGRGTAQQVKELIAKVKQTVKNKFNVELKEEVFYLGRNDYDQ